jgi:hypothetical protein
MSPTELFGLRTEGRAKHEGQGFDLICLLGPVSLGYGHAYK